MGTRKGLNAQTIAEHLVWAENLLCEAGAASPRTDAEWALAHILVRPRTDLHLRAHDRLSEEQALQFCELMRKRARRVPLQHLLGETEFWGLPFKTTAAALIPRADTETLVEILSDRLRDHPGPCILDVGTGAGIIAIALAHELPRARLIATDISLPALFLARENAHRNGVAGRIAFVRADLTSAVAPSACFDAIASNPPYIRTGDIAGLDPEVRDHDPHLALDGGADGLAYYRRLVRMAASHLHPGGDLALEIGCDQTEDVGRLLAQQPSFAPPVMHRDLSGRPRVMTAVKTRPY